MVTVIFLFRLICGDDVPKKIKKNIGITGQVEEIVSGGASIVIRDVCIDGKYYKVKIYSSSKKDENSISFSELKIGQIVSFDGTLQSFSSPGNPGQFNEYKYYKELGIDFCYFAKSCHVENENVNILEQGLYNLRQTLCEGLEMSLPPQEAGTMAAMVFGEKSSLDTEIKDLYKQNGIAHILAISGVKTLKLDIPLVPKTRINWAFVPLHIAIIYILKLCLDEEIIPRCRFPCSRGYLTKYIN